MEENKSDLLLEALHELRDNLMDGLPTNMEEAREFVMKDDDTVKNIVIAASLDTLVSMLVAKGVIDEDEFNKKAEEAVHASIDKIAEKFLMRLESEVFDYETD